MEKKYKWKYPFEWLEEKVDKWSPGQVKCALALAVMTDSDTLQDLFQGEMTDDGYFDPIKTED